MPKVTFNGQTYEAEKGRTIIQVADEVGIQIPRYCYHPDIGIEGKKIKVNGQMLDAYYFCLGGSLGLIGLKCVLGGAAMWFLFRAARLGSDDPHIWAPVFVLTAEMLGHWYLFRRQPDDLDRKR